MDKSKPPRKPFILPEQVLVWGFLFFAFLQAGLFAPIQLNMRAMSEHEIKETLVAGDFRILWAQAALAANGHAADAYDPEKLMAYARASSMLPKEIYAYGSFYPPHFLLLMEPLGSLPLPVAWPLFIWGSLLLLGAAAWFAFPRCRYALPLLFAFPGLWGVIAFGQLTPVVCALFLITLALALRHPRFAGLALGIATFKPHLGVMIPLLLLLRRSWSLIIAATLTTLILLALALLLLGPDSMTAYFGRITAPIERLADFKSVTSNEMISLYAGLRRIATPPLLALAGHALLAAIAFYIMLSTCRRTRDIYLQFASVMTATLMIVPHAYSYDMLLLYIPLMVVIRRAQERGWRMEDLEVIAIPAIIPLFVGEVNYVVKLPVVPAALFLLLDRLHTMAKEDEKYNA